MKDKRFKKVFAGLTALCVLFGGTSICAAEGENALETGDGTEKQTEVGVKASEADVPAKKEEIKQSGEAEEHEEATSASAPIDAPTEEATAAPTQDATATPTEEATSAPTEGATAIPTEGATAVPTEEATAAPTEEATPAPTEASKMAENAESAAEPTEIFVAGYAAVASKTIFYGENGDERTLDGGAIVYAFDYDEKKDRVCVAFHEDARIQKAWVDAQRLRMLDEEAVKEYLEGDPREALEWKDFLLWPLTFQPEEESEETKVENLNVPESTDEVPVADAQPASEAEADGMANDAATNAETDLKQELEEGSVGSSEDAPTPETDEKAAANAGFTLGESAEEEGTTGTMPAMEIAVDIPLAPKAETEPEETAPSDAVMPAMAIDFAQEMLRVAAPETAGTLRFMQPGSDVPVYEQQLSEACGIELEKLGGAPCENEVVLRVSLISEGMESAGAELRIPARPEFAGVAGEAQIETGYTSVRITDVAGNTYALSLPEETEPGLFSEDGVISGLTGGATYAIWARNPASEGRFASAWAKVEGTICETLSQTLAEASFDVEGIVRELHVEWRPDMEPFDPAEGICFRSEGASIDEAAAGNISAVWRDAQGEALTAAPVNAGTYTLELKLTGEADRYVLREPCLSYIIDPIDLSTANFALFEGERCVYNGKAQYPADMRVVLDEHVIPEECYELRANGDANHTDAGEACALIVGANENVVGQRAFAYRIEPRAVTVIPERPMDFSYNGGVDVPLEREGWALDGAIEGDVLTLDLTNATATVASPEAGEGKAVRFEGVALAGADAANYTIGEIDACTVNIFKADAPEIEWPTAETIEYGQTLSEVVFTGGSTNLGSFTWADGARAPGAGESRYEAVFVPTDALNYDWPQEKLRGEIAVKVNPRPATIYAGSFEKRVGQADPSFTASTEGVLKGDALAYTLSREKGEAQGSYVIHVKPGKNPNYSVKTRNGVLTIRARSINESTVTVSEIPRQVYTGSPIEPKPVVRDGSTLLQRDVDYRLEYHGNRLEGVGTIDIVGMGAYSGTRTVSFTIYKLSSIGGISNNYGVEGESSGGSGFDDAYVDDAEDWESGAYNFLPQAKLLGNPLYDEYMGTGEGMEELNIVRDGSGAAREYALVPVYAQAEFGGEVYDADGALLISAGPDESGEPSDRVFCFSGMQLARLYAERGMSTLLLRNCETTLCLDVYEMISGDVAKLVKLLNAGEANESTALDALDFDALEEEALTTGELALLRFELRSEAVEMENGEPGYDLRVCLCLNGMELEVSGLLPSLMVGANVEGLYEEGEEEAFLEQYANARVDENGEAQCLEGELAQMPDALPDWQADTATCYLAAPEAGKETIVVREERDAQLDLYRCQTLVSPWAGPGLYLLLDGQGE